LSAVTDANGHAKLMIAVCIPWRDAHVRTARSDAGSWDEHVEFCEQLHVSRQSLDAQVPTVVVGDFNQRIPGSARGPIRAASALTAALDGLTVWTASETSCGGLIDHVAGSDQLVLERALAWPADDAGQRLSDHAGVACDVRIASPE
jgi:endonuclease/exonuclease/phosphatase family metal-dependent hydrolase